MKIILASASPRRKELLHMLFEAFEIMTAGGEECAEFENVAQYAQALALQKMEKVLAQNSFTDEPEYLILSADTIVFQNGKVLGKPMDEPDARRMLSGLSGAVHEVYTGVCITLLKNGMVTAQKTFSEITKVSVMEMTENEIQAYIDSGEPFDKAGGYGIQGIFGKYIKGIEGDYYNVVGLPVNRIYRELKILQGASE